MTEACPLRLFISYSRKDDGFRQQLETHLSMLRRQRLIDVWSDRDIEAGEEWEPNILGQLETADIILLLISPDFLASDYCYDVELQRALERHRAGAARVIPIYLRPCDWKGAWFGELQGEPDEARPVTRWEDRDEAFTAVAKAIRKAGDSLLALRRRCPKPAPPTVDASEQPNSVIFRDVPFAPVMVVLPAGEFRMGSPDGDPQAFDCERPQHLVRIGYRFAVGRYPVTFAEWEACVADGGIDFRPNDQGWGRERQPVINVTWEDAHHYLYWLSRKTGQIYRLLSEAEWEYAARAGAMTRYWWGDAITPRHANYDGSGNEQTTAVGHYPENPFKLCDMIGNVWEWTEDCWHPNYGGAPTDGSPWSTGLCGLRVIRGGSWANDPRNVRCASRGRFGSDKRDGNIGFRVARSC